MIVDLAGLPENAFGGRSFDVCIVGAGPAGITLATRLAPSLDVLLVEGGGLEHSEQSQELYQGTSSGRDYFPLDVTRLRYFGGSSNHWGGWCQALEDLDFETHEHVPYSGWPIGKAELDPYFAAAADILDIAPDAPAPAYKKGLDEIVARDGRLAPYQFLWSAPTRFGEKFRPTIEAAANITCLINANLTDIRLSDSGNAVRSIEVSDYAGKARSLAARALVVAAGGLENPRILLNCASQAKAGIGNANDLVGRFFGEHPQHTLGSLVLEDELRAEISASLSYRQMLDKRNFTFYRATRAFVQGSRLTNFSLRFIPLVTGGGGGFSDRLRNAICSPDWLSSGLDLVSFGDRQYCREGLVHLSIEQAPNRNSRVTLGEARDRFGRRRLNLDWRMSDLDRRTIRFASVHFARLLAERDLGRMKVAEWVLAEDGAFPGPSQDEAAGHHHMGTTRMADDPKSGVVDRNCRVHGMENLYIAGSSVFATTGQTNPTFTIVQLALRLAEHLNSNIA